MRRSSSIPPRPRPISTASTCCSRAAKKSRRATASPTCSPAPPTTGTCTWWPAWRCAATACTTKRWTQFSRALKLNPANAPILYNHRARVYHYQNQIELAGDELEKGLALEPRHPLLRTSAGYQQMRLGNLDAAIEILEGVVRDDELAAHRRAHAGACATCRPASASAPRRC